MDVALAQHDVVAALHLDLVAVFGREQHEIADLGRAHVLAVGDDLRPHQPLRHLRRRRDEDATLAAPLAVGVRDAHEHAVVEHLDRQLVVGRAHSCKLSSGGYWTAASMRSSTSGVSAGMTSSAPKFSTT